MPRCLCQRLCPTTGRAAFAPGGQNNQQKNIACGAVLEIGSMHAADCNVLDPRYYSTLSRDHPVYMYECSTGISDEMNVRAFVQWL
jgi:hypothetical protein